MHESKENTDINPSHHNCYYILANAILNIISIYKTYMAYLCQNEMSMVIAVSIYRGHEKQVSIERLAIVLKHLEH